MKKDLRDLIICAKNGDKSAEEQLYKKFEPLIIKLASYYNEFDEDCKQELSDCFISAIKGGFLHGALLFNQ